MALSWAPRVLVSLPRQVPHAVAALLQLHMPPVVLLVVVEGFGAVRVGSINHAEGVAAQLHRAQTGAYWVSSCSAVSTASGCKPGRVSLCMARSTICTFSTDTTPALQRGQPRQHRFQLFPQHRPSGSNSGRGPDPGGGFTWGELQHLHQEPDQGGGQ